MCHFVSLNAVYFHFHTESALFFIPFSAFPFPCPCHQFRYVFYTELSSATSYFCSQVFARSREIIKEKHNIKMREKRPCNLLFFPSFPSHSLIIQPCSFILFLHLQVKVCHVLLSALDAVRAIFNAWTKIGRHTFARITFLLFCFAFLFIMRRKRRQTLKIKQSTQQ